ncbi:proline-rich protein 5-like isoform X2 [Ptychodera flava]|uniref:proline-rich protein 5-like isoform X2 n=1 Tax=Ptychodera flava TaxID=63121 RepID=UPI003969DBAF
MPHGRHQRRRSNKTEPWKDTESASKIGLQSSISGIFQHERVDPTEVYELHKKIQTVLKSEISTFLGEYYRTHLLKKGMLYLLEEILSKGDGNVLLHALADLWVKFFSTMLPQIQAIFNPVQTTDLTIRQMTLVGFRDTIVLDANIIDAIIAPNAKLEAEVTQMLLVLQHVHECKPPSRNYLQLEELVARVVSPYIGTRGLYIGGKIITQRKVSTVSRREPDETRFSRNGMFTRSIPRSKSHDEYNNNNELRKDFNNRVIFSITDESEGSSCGELSDHDRHTDYDVSVPKSRQSNLRRGSVPLLLLASHLSEEDLREEDSISSDPEESSSPSTLSPLPQRKRSTSDCPDPQFVRNARRASLPLGTSRSILKSPSTTIEVKGRKGKLRSFFSQKKSKSVHYARNDSTFNK